MDNFFFNLFYIACTSTTHTGQLYKKIRDTMGNNKLVILTSMRSWAADNPVLSVLLETGGMSWIFASESDFPTVSLSFVELLEAPDAFSRIACEMDTCTRKIRWNYVVNITHLKYCNSLSHIHQYIVQERSRYLIEIIWNINAAKLTFPTKALSSACCFLISWLLGSNLWANSASTIGKSSISDG